MNPARAAIAVALLALRPLAAHADPMPDPGDFAQIARGRTLLVEADCAACHEAPDGRAFAGGRPLKTPFGTILSSNITPDPTTGIGGMTPDQFVDVLQKGRGPGGEHIYPAMPYPFFAGATRADALAIYAYLRTVTPIRNEVVTNRLPFPFDIRPSLALWDLLYFRKQPFRRDPTRSEAWNQGGYLVNGLEHCGACHTPRTLLGGEERDRALQGGVLQGWFAPDLTGDPRRGLGGWSEDDIVSYLRSGHNRFASAAGPMAEEVHHSSSSAPVAELHEIAVYLKSLPAAPGPDPAPAAPDAATMAEGAAIYRQECSACHKPDGTGVPDLFPRLAGGAGAQQSDPTTVVRVILQGARTVQTRDQPTGPAMPSFAWNLSDADVAAVATYVRNAWGNRAPVVRAGTVHVERRDLERAGSG